MLSDQNGMPLRISMKTALRNEIIKDVLKTLDYHSSLNKLQQSIKDESNKFTSVNKHLLDLNEEIQKKSVFIEKNQKDVSYVKSQIGFVKSNNDRLDKMINEMRFKIA